MEQKGKSQGGQPGRPVEAPETAVKGTPTTAIEMGVPGQGKPEAHYSRGDGSVAEFDKDGVTTRTGLGMSKPDDAAGAPPPDGDDAVPPPEEGAEEAVAEDLGAYDPTNEETAVKFDEAYTVEREDGSTDINMDRLSAEWFGNAAKNETDPTTGKLNDGTYAYLQDRFGVSLETIKDIEAGVRAQHFAALNEVYDRAGGQERLNAAVQWGQDGGYSPDEAKRFNGAMNSSDPVVVNEAIDVLMARYDKANAAPQTRGRRPVRPRRDATQRGTAPGVQGYESYAEYQKEAREARKSGDNAKLAETRRKLAVSPWFRQRGR